MKTPEEIKKGLECCILETDDTSLVDHCKACPYQPTGLCFRTLLKDALASTQQFEAQVPKWISVEERLPDDGVDVIVYTDRCGGCVEYAYYRYGRCEWFKNCILLRYNVTHWMPLPEPPKEG